MSGIEPRRTQIERALLEDKYATLQRINRLKADMQAERDRLVEIDRALAEIKEGV